MVLAVCYLREVPIGVAILLENVLTRIGMRQCKTHAARASQRIEIALGRSIGPGRAVGEQMLRAVGIIQGCGVIAVVHNIHALRVNPIIADDVIARVRLVVVGVVKRQRESGTGNIELLILRY